LHFLSAAGADAPAASYVHHPDGLLLVDDGRVVAAVQAGQLLPRLASADGARGGA
jgi:hypothetical protein